MALTITRRALKVIADALSRGYGLRNPKLTYSEEGKGLMNGDTLFRKLAKMASANSD